MITRPLDLASKLRPDPRSFDWLFLVNGGLVVLFFTLFGSRFVLAPGVAVLPAIAGATAGARVTTHQISVVSADQIFAGDGLRDLDQLNEWLVQQAKGARYPTPVLLLQVNARVEFDVVARIGSMANANGFQVQIAAVEPLAPGRRDQGAR
jgi:biopolymer transport protein ExbD